MIKLYPMKNLLMTLTINFLITNFNFHINNCLMLKFINYYLFDLKRQFLLHLIILKFQMQFFLGQNFIMFLAHFIPNH